MAESDEYDVARFMLRHFRAEARAAAHGIELEAAEQANGAKAERWRRLGEAITLLQAAGVMDEIAAEAAGAKGRRRARPAGTGRVDAPRRGPVPYLRLVVA